jgi:predicted RNase H-like HicB family nuclease
MKTYSFKVVVEPDEDADGNPAWHAYCPALVSMGAATSGQTRDEALKNIGEVVQLVVESMIEHGEQLPEESAEELLVTVEPRVTVNV